MRVRTVQLGDVSAVSAGQGAPQNRDAFGSEGHPFIRAASLDALCEDGSFNSLERIDESAAKEHRLRLYAPGTVVFAKSGMSATKNRIYRLSRPAYVVNHLAAVAPSEELDSVFLRYWLEHFNPTRLIQDSAYPSISQEDIESVSLSLPDLSEQKRIAGLLEQAVLLRRTRRYALELSDTFLPAAFHELFGDLRMNPHRFEIQELGDICDVRDGTHDSPTFHQNGIPLVTSKNLVNGYVDLTEVDLISEEDFIAINKRSKVDRGDILMPMIGTIGNPVLVDHEPSYAIKNVALIKSIEHSPSALYIRELLRSSYFDYLTARNSRGGTQKFIALGDIRSFHIPMPPLSLQTRFANIVREEERLRAAQGESLRQADHLFQSLLYRSFSVDR